MSRALRDPLGGNFPGNRIPASRLNQPAQKFLQTFVPLPNRPDGLLSTASQQTIDDDQYVVKIDHLISTSNQLSGRLVRNSNVFNEAAGNLPGFLAGINYENWNVAINDTHILSANLLNTFTFSFSDIDRRQLSIVPENKTWQDFGAATMIFWGAVTALTLVAEYFAGAFGAKRWGSSIFGIWGSFIGAIIGMLLFNLPGLIVGTFAGAIIGEIIAGRSLGEAVKSGKGAIIGFLAGSLFKVVIGLLMIGTFIWQVIIR